jgi:uncharacterized protein
MRPSIALNNNIKAVHDAINKYCVTNPRVFGSVANGSDGENSDLDILIDAMPQTTLFDIGGLQIELEKILKIPVDIKTPFDLPEKIRKIVLHEAKPL